jgi:hypothetical protein
MIKLLEYFSRYDYQYNTAGFAYYLYGLSKMIRPKVYIDLGTGYGITSFMVAQAMKENNIGTVYTFDNTSQWDENEDYEKFIKDKIKKFDLTDQIKFKKTSIDFLKMKEVNNIKNIDIIFNDINSEPIYFFSLFPWIMERINETCYYFIDGAATFYKAYSVLELSMKELNKGKVPINMLPYIKDINVFESLIKKYKFTLLHIIKNTSHHQNSVSLIKIEKNNIGYD